ncbi:MAG: DNA polymerase III subunit delta [Bacteroidetes bacterium]|nr:MAG: DNA polymerase III subunit delta [Bacteroidota bacterium]
MLFKEIIGQQEVKGKLLSLVREDRTPHAMMLFGPEGTGKLALAVAMTQYLACNDRQEDDACGVCPSCIKFGKLVHPDLHFVVPVLKTGSMTAPPVSDDYAVEWREALLTDLYLTESQWYESLGAENKQGIINVKESENIIRKLAFKPYESDYRMVVIWLPEKMNQPAANKLLKLIEEPPEKTLILMVSEHTNKILPTILSRTQLFHVPPISGADLREGLMKLGQADQQQIEDAVLRANGNMSTALQTLRQDDVERQHFELFTELMRLSYARDIVQINGWVERVAGMGRERQKQVIDYSLRLLRENFILNMENDSLNYMSAKESEFSRKFSPFIHEGNVHALAETFTLAGNHIEANGNARIILMDLSIRVIRLLMQKATAAN